jgi:hypothetical protein
MAPSIVEVLKTADNVTTAQTLTSSGMSVGDTLVVFYGSDYYQLSNMPDATSTAGTLTSLGSVDIGTNIGHIKAYLCSVTTGGAQTVTFPQHSGGSDIHGCVLRISSAVTQDGSTATNLSTTNTTSHLANGVTTTSTDRILCIAWLASLTGGFTAGDIAYTAPGAMTKQAESDAANFSSMMTCSMALPTAGASGTETATFSRSCNFGAISIAVGGSTPTGQPKNGAFFSLLR